MAYTTQGHHLTTLISLHKTFHLTPTPPKEPKDEEKRLKPKKRAQNSPLGAKSLKTGLKLGKKGIKAQKGAKALTKGLKP